jgi:hypothetical protein
MVGIGVLTNWHNVDIVFGQLPGINRVFKLAIRLCLDDVPSSRTSNNYQKCCECSVGLLMLIGGMK